MSRFDYLSTRLKEIICVESDPVGVFLLENRSIEPFNGWERVTRHRYCQAVMKARRGAAILLDKDDLSCPAAAAAFGFRPLPHGLASGEGLVGFGIVENAETGRTMFDQMPQLSSGTVNCLALSPLEKAPRLPEVVVIEGEPERLMWLVLADLNLARGARRHANTAVLQATCVDATVIPFKEQRLNFSLGCYGCREATDLAPNETVLGFPGAMLEPLVQVLDSLSKKAIPRSRTKAPYRTLVERNQEPTVSGENARC
jgi:uncharacterized protein (DUF169 family)